MLIPMELSFQNHDSIQLSQKNGRVVVVGRETSKGIWAGFIIAWDCESAEGDHGGVVLERDVVELGKMVANFYT